MGVVSAALVALPQLVTCIIKRGKGLGECGHVYKPAPSTHGDVVT